MSFGPSGPSPAQQAQEKYSANTEEALGLGKEFITGSAKSIGGINQELNNFMGLLLNGGLNSGASVPRIATDFGGFQGGLYGGNPNNQNPFEALAKSAAEASGSQYRAGSDALASDLSARGLDAGSGAGLAALTQLNFQGGQVTDAANRQAAAQAAQFGQQQRAQDIGLFGQQQQYDLGLRGQSLQRDLANMTSLLGAMGLQSQNVGSLLGAGGSIFGNALQGQGQNAANLSAAEAQNAQGSGDFFGAIIGGLLNLIPVVGPILGGAVSSMTQQAQPYTGPTSGTGYGGRY